MKYIKAYEDISGFPILVEGTVLYKYILYKANENTYFILEVTDYVNGYGPNYIACKKLFIYTILIDRLRKGKHQYYNIGINKFNEIIFQSNNLQEVKDSIKTLKNYNKFNL